VLGNLLENVWSLHKGWQDVRILNFSVLEYDFVESGTEDESLWDDCFKYGLRSWGVVQKACHFANGLAL
jgi:hypothetical protein